MKPLLLILFTCGWCFAQTELITFTNKNGSVIKDAKVVKVNPNGLILSYPGGGGSVAFVDLPEEVQKRFGFTPQNAAEFEAALRSKKATEDRALEERANARLQAKLAAEQAARDLKSAMVIEGKVSKKLDAGVLVFSAYDRLITNTVPYAGYNSRGGFSTSDGGVIRSFTNNMQIYIGPCLLTDHPNFPRLSEGDVIHINAWANGKFSYVTTKRQSQTIPRFTAVFSKVTKPPTPAEDKALRSYKGRDSF